MKNLVFPSPLDDYTWHDKFKYPGIQSLLDGCYYICNAYILFNLLMYLSIRVIG
jgi:hypothetical protein